MRTTVYVVVAVGLSLAIGYPVAWYAARHAGRWSTALLVALVLPFWISYLMRMFAWTNLLDAGRLRGARARRAARSTRCCASVGLFEPGGWLGGQHVTVIMGLVYGYVPYLILPLYAALDRIDPRMIEAARDLGASPAGAFRHVVLPRLADRRARRDRDHRAADVRRLLHARADVRLAAHEHDRQRHQRRRCCRARTSRSARR